MAYRRQNIQSRGKIVLMVTAVTRRCLGNQQCDLLREEEERGTVGLSSPLSRRGRKKEEDVVKGEEIAAEE